MLRFLLASMVMLSLGSLQAADIKVGIIGLDTSHVVAFTKLLNDPESQRRPGGRPGRGRLSRRQPGHPRQPRPRRRASPSKLREKLGVEIVDSIDALLHEGRRRAAGERRRPAAPGAGPAGAQGGQAGVHRQAGRRLAGRRGRDLPSWRSEHKVPCFSSSSLRFSPGIAGHAERSRRSARSSAATPTGPARWSRTIPTCSGTASTASRRCSRSWAPAASRVTRVQTKDDRLVVGRLEGRPDRHLPRHPRGQGGLRRPRSSATKGDRAERRLRRLRAAGRRDLQVLPDRQAAGQPPRRRSRSSPSWKPPTRASARAAPR